MSLSLDLDNKWSYLKTHGDPSWQQFPSYFDVAIPRILAFLRQYNLRITFFIVGQDAAIDRNRESLQQIAAAGHEIANHSFNHDPWLHLYSREQLNEELARAEESIESVTQTKVHGFRGPGFSLSENTLSVLKERNYAYDATVFPNVLNPLARAYFFARSNLTSEEKKQRKALFGTFSDALRPIKPFNWKLQEGDLLELPVTTMPYLKTPIHFSYLVYLASYSATLANLYLSSALFACRISHTEPSLLLHPLDFLGCDDESDLGFFPAMNIPSEQKLGYMHGFFGRLVHKFVPVTMDEHISAIQAGAAVSHRAPRF